MTPLVIKLCRKYGDMSQSSATPWDAKNLKFETALYDSDAGRSGIFGFLLVASTGDSYQAEVRGRTFLERKRLLEHKEMTSTFLS
jgi:hypothetical protein